MITGMPVERCTFGSLAIAFDERVLRPRPWTLAQSEWAVELAAGAPPGPILELCAGVGHIGLVAALRTGRTIVQVDVNERACELARANAASAGAAALVDVRCAPLSSALAPDERFPLVIADPPYVPTDDVALYPEDPTLAIDGGADGLVVVDECLRVAAAHLAGGGRLVLQLRGERQAAALAARSAELVVSDVRSFGPDRAVAVLAPAGASVATA